ncbi:MAG TPA: U32 family peptidase [Candidatus Hydromicrobium sp.]
MNKTIKKIELTAPAGGWDQLVAAVNAGTDSVYLGYKKFGARAYAENFDMSQLKKVVSFAHGRSVKVYLTLNTLIKDSEIKEVINFLNQYASICSDGIIIQDYGIYKILKDLFKTIPVHASTQLNIHNFYSLKLLSRLGFKRAILAREMTLDEIKNLSKEKLMEIEVFGHGSQCYSYSGSCYFSSFIGGRSGNRGRCTQPCRMKYKFLERKAGKSIYIIADGSYLLNKSDLCLLDIIPEIITAGVDALKIEGRMKSPEYVGIVTKIYRKYIDLYYSNPLNYKVDEFDFYKLTQIFSREIGTGYIRQKYPADIISLKKSGSIGNFLGRVYKIDCEDNSKKKIRFIYIKSRWKINSGDIIEVWTKKGNSRINIKDFELLEDLDKNYKYKIKVDKASNILEKDRVFKYFDKKIDKEARALLKYDFNKENTEILPKIRNRYGRMNENERDHYLNKFLSNYNQTGIKKTENKLTISAYIYDYKYIEPAIYNGANHVIYTGFKELLDSSGIESSIVGSLKKYNKIKNIKISVGTPYIIYDSDFIWVEKNILKLLDCGLKNYKISNPAVLELLNEIGSKRNHDISLYLGFNFNLFNSLSLAFFNGLISVNTLLKGIEFSPELNLEEISKIISNAENFYKDKDKPEFSIYGHGYFQTMGSRYKIKFLTGKSNGNKYYIEDIKGYQFPAGSDYNENMIIFNSRNICTLYDLDKIKASGVNNIIIDSRFYDEKNFCKIIKNYREAIEIIYSEGINKYRIFTSNLQNDNLFKNYSKGHLLRGVE